MKKGGRYYKIGGRKVREQDLTAADRKAIDKRQAEARAAAQPGGQSTAAAPTSDADPSQTTEQES